jgi:isoquinoline 1-oxidoreductase alpha subunit
MIKLTINGEQREFAGEGDMPLLWYLRDILGLTGSKYACGKALCGSCTVHLDGQAVRSCTVPMSGLEGASVTTIEGLDARGEHPLQIAWAEHKVPQCGYCQSGQIMSAAALLANVSNPTDRDIDNALSGNICRCGCYVRILRAVQSAAVARQVQPVEASA